jgi:DNA-binding CsgD family transcriptional regulator
MNVPEIDEKTRAALGRLTAGEKECLHRRLRHQSAKEMAIELGVSPHAVEKRLKMARAKLGLSSSLEAARLLADSEWYQQTTPRSPELALTGASVDKGAIRQAAWGVIVVSLLAVTLIVLATQGPSSGGVTSLDSGNMAPYPNSQAATALPTGIMVQPTAAELHMVVVATFGKLDEDKSGFIEPAETPVAGRGTFSQKIYSRDEQGNVRETGQVRTVSADEARSEYIAQGDRDGDGKWSFAEYREWMKSNVARTGIPAAWREDIESAY